MPPKQELLLSRMRGRRKSRPHVWTKTYVHVRVGAHLGAHQGNHPCLHNLPRVYFKLFELCRRAHISRGFYQVDMFLGAFCTIFRAVLSSYP